MASCDQNDLFLSLLRRLQADTASPLEPVTGPDGTVQPLSPSQIEMREATLETIRLLERALTP